MTTPPYCCEISQNANEPLLPTAPHAEWWLLLEYRAAWGRDVLPDSDLSPVVKDHLVGWLDTLPHSKLLFIRQPARTTDSIMLYLHNAIRGETFSAEVSTYDDLTFLDLDMLQQGTPSSAPLYLICVNGKRDVACSKFGMPVYEALRNSVGEAAWQCSHLGGHRFAATGVFLPHGIVYGRLTADAVADVATAHASGQVVTEYYRGRSVFPHAIQFAEGTLLAESANAPRAGWQMTAVTTQGDHHTEVVLQHADTTRTMLVAAGASDFKIAKSTGDDLIHVPVYHVIASPNT